MKGYGGRKKEEDMEGRKGRYGGMEERREEEMEERER